MTLVRLFPVAAFAVCALPLGAQETRHMDAHVHGTGAVQIAIEGTTVAMDITVPGADIVGFEHAPGSNADRAAIDAALVRFDDAFALFTLEGDAGCTAVTKVSETHGYGITDDHDHAPEMKASDEHDHDHDHGHDDHDHVAEAGHDDHGHDHAHEAAHDDDDHADGGNHAEFNAVYEMTCADPGAITAIGFPYFQMFENARELDVQIVSDSGAMADTVRREAPRLVLDGAM